MKRPFVHIEKENMIEIYLKEANRFVKQLSQHDEVKAILLNGGLSRGYGDLHSEIDLVVYLSEQGYNTVQENKAWYPQGICVINGFLYDIKSVSLEQELNKSLDMVGKWDISYAKIMYDPTNELKEYMHSQLSKGVDHSLVEDLLFNTWWYVFCASKSWMYREDLNSVHAMLNEALKKVVSAMYVLNNEYIPHEKWLFHMCTTLKVLPQHFHETLSTCMIVSLDKEATLHRLHQIESLGQWIDDTYKQFHSQQIPVALHQKFFYDMLLWLVEEKQVTKTQWSEKASLSLLSMEPFYSLTTISNETIDLDFHKMKTLSKDMMYVWFYEIVDAIRKKL